MSYKYPTNNKCPPPFLQQKSFVSIRQFENNKTRLSIRLKKAQKNMHMENATNKLIKYPSHRKIALCQTMHTSLERKSRSVGGIIPSPIMNNDERKHSLTFFSQKAKKSMQRKLSELIRNEHLAAAKKAIRVSYFGTLGYDGDTLFGCKLVVFEIITVFLVITVNVFPN